MKIKIDVGSGRNIFFTSDWHCGHTNILRFDERPFPNLRDMHEALVMNWNDVVKPEDVVFYMGDLHLGKPELGLSIMSRLCGEIHFIMGNHDEFKEIKKIPNIASINDIVDLRVLNSPYGKDVHFELCHYPMYSWNRKPHGSYHIHAHSHHGLSLDEIHQNNRIVDAGCNGWGYTPISYHQVIKDLSKIDYKISSNHH